MPWRDTSPMDQRTQFIADHLRDSLSITELCELYGVSRKTGYKWIDRYLRHGPAGLEERSRRPRHSPRHTAEEIVTAILVLKGAAIATRLTSDPPGAKVSLVVDGIKPLAIAGVSDLPFFGKLLFAHSPLVYLSLVLFAAIEWFLFHTRAGLVLRAVGESPQSAHAIGYPVVSIRYLAVLFGGACAGLGGAYLAVAYTPLWTEGMTSGRGWIALALVVFATWKPRRVLAGAYLFGAVTLAQFQAQALGVALPSQLLAMLPYLATILVLTIISRDAAMIRLNAPASLGQPYHPDE